MNIKLIKLYSRPEIFKPIIFKSGINIVLGQKVENSEQIQGKKNNGVGKSLSIEFINFCLLKEYNESRVSLIPKTLFSEVPEIILDLKINDTLFSIHRKMDESENITIFENNEEHVFETLNDARNYLNKFIGYDRKYQKTPTFRELLSPIIRDENTGFNNILLSNAGFSNNIPPNVRPHLYFFGLSLEIYEKIKKIIKDFDDTKTVVNNIKKSLNCTTIKQINDERAILNSLNDEVEKMQKTIESFKTMDSFKQVQDEIISIETDLDILKTQRKTIKSEIKKIETVPEYEDIKDDEIVMLYNIFKEGLGDKISKSLEQVQSFKKKIDDFQQSIVKEHYENLNNTLRSLNSQIRDLDDLYSEKIKIISDKGMLSDLKTSFKIYDQKNKELSEKRYKIGEYDKYSTKKEQLAQRHNDELLNLKKLLDDNQEVIKSFETTILNMHEEIMGNKEAYFRIDTTKNKNVLDFDLRIKDDGSYSTNRLKVFMYDFSILFNEYTQKNSLNLLIHDNVFQVDNDSLIRCLNLLQKYNEYEEEFQYIFTMNRDILDVEEIKSVITLDIDENKIASFTKEEPFLGKSYRETK